MKYSRSHVEEALSPGANTSKRLTSRLILHILKLTLLAVVLLGAWLAAFAYGTVRGIVDTAPEAESLTVTPLGIASNIYDAGGRLKETLITSGSNRDPVAISSVPNDLINAFVAIEDERFWTHEGVDIRGILRSAASLLLNGKINGGASTITQQLIKNNVFNGGSEKGWGAKFIRKFQEQYLALLMESEVSKADILISYLNSINLGQNCLGIQVASQRYFQKNVWELDLSECACLAGITQNPYRYNPITFPTNNAVRRKSVLDHMLDQGLISDVRYREAPVDTDELYERIRLKNLKDKETASSYSYFTDAVINAVLKDLQTELGYSESDAYTLLYSGGLNIYSTQDSAYQKILDDEINDPDNYPDNAFKWSFSYQLKATLSDGTTHTYTENHIKNAYGLTNLIYNSKEEIEELVDRFKKDSFTEGDSLAGERIYYTLQPQLAGVIIDYHNGRVLAMTGGRGEKTVSRSLNRVTDAFRSPGSPFKVLSTFAPAIDCCGQTLSSMQPDMPFNYNGATIRNWWGSDLWLGTCSIRQAITYSMNVTSANFLVNTVGFETAMDYLEKFGFSSLVRSEVINGKVYTDLGPTLCLGGLTYGVNLLELTNAFGAIANKGDYIEPIYYTRITDHYGNVLLDKTQETHEVVSDTTAYLLTQAMANSFEKEYIKNTWIDSSSYIAKLDKMPAAGKSGTSTDTTGKSRDCCFCAFSPYIICGVWTGFDDGNVALQGNVDLTSYHKLIWKNVMDRIHEELPVKQFTKPKGIVTKRVCSLSGKLAVEGICDQDPRCQVYTESFAADNVPTEYCDCHTLIKICNETNLEAGPGCLDCSYKIYYTMAPTTPKTVDAPYLYIEDEHPAKCHLHDLPEESEPETDENGDPIEPETDENGEPIESESTASGEEETVQSGES